MAFPDAFLDQIREALPVSSVVGAHVNLRREGIEWRGVDDHSLTCNDHKKLWWDHGGQAEGGDVFDWLVKREGLSFPEAVQECASLAGLPLPAGAGSARSTPRRGRDDAIQCDEVPFAPVDEGNGAAPRSGPEPHAGGPKPKKEIVATFDYTDAQGDLVYQVVRWQFRLPNGEWERGKDGLIKKTFSQRRPDPAARDGWAWNLDGVEHGLYRLVELREEMGEGRAVFLVEGERDADTLWDWGLPATTNSGGAKNWRVDHAERFRGADVVVLTDNDEAGRDRGEAVAKSLHGVAARTRVLDWRDCWADAPAKADVTDWRDQAGGTAEKLLNLVATLPRWTPPPWQSHFGALPWERLDDPGPEHEFLIDGWFTVGDKSIIGGPSKSGKSFLAIHAALCVARGAEFFGATVMSPGLVVYQAGEGARGIKKRLRAYRQHFGISPLERVPFVLLTAKIDLYRADGDTDALIAEINEIAKQYPGVPLRAVFIDTLATATGGADENSGKDMAAVMGNVDKINLATGAHTCLVHHMNAAGTKLRGHTSIYANIDQVINVTRDEVTKIRTAVLDKQKDGEDGGILRFELAPVEIGRRVADDKPITSCVTIDVGDREIARARGGGFKLTPQEELVFRALITALGEYGRSPPADNPRIPPEMTVVTWTEWRDVYARPVIVEEDDERKRGEAIKKAMQRAGVTLLKFGVIGRDNPFCWWSGKPVRGFGKDVPAPTAESMPP